METLLGALWKKQAFRLISSRGMMFCTMAQCLGRMITNRFERFGRRLSLRKDGKRKQTYWIDFYIEIVN